MTKGFHRRGAEDAAFGNLSSLNSSSASSVASVAVNYLISVVMQIPLKYIVRSSVSRRLTTVITIWVRSGGVCLFRGADDGERRAKDPALDWFRRQLDRGAQSGDERDHEYHRPRGCGDHREPAAGGPCRRRPADEFQGSRRDYQSQQARLRRDQQRHRARRRTSGVSVAAAGADRSRVVCSTGGRAK